MAGGRKRKAQDEIPVDDAPPADAPVPAVQPQNPAADNGVRADRAEVMARVARSRAAHFAHFKADDDDEAADNVHTGAQAARTLGPWSSAVELVDAREKAAAAREEKRLHGERGAGGAGGSGSGAWRPSRSLALGARPTAAGSVPSLFQLCLDLLTTHIDCVESLEGVPDAIRVPLATNVCIKRKMSPQVSLLFSGSAPSEVVVLDCTQMDPAAMCALLKDCVTPRLERLELRFCGRGLGDEAVAVLAGQGQLVALQVLHLGGAYRLTDTALEKVLSVMPNLTSLSLPSASRLTGAAIEKLPALVPKLRQLHLQECRGVSGEALCRAVPQLVALQALSLDTIDEVTDAVLARICRGPCLRELSLGFCQAVTDRGVAAVAAGRPSLQSLQLDDCGKVTDGGLAELAAQCKDLQALSVRRCGKLSDAALAEVAGRGALRRLSVAGVAGAGPQLLAALTLHCRDSLEYLDVSFCRGVAEDCLGRLADRCTRLTSLRVFGCSQVTRRFLHGHSNDRLVEVVGTGAECH